MKVIVLKIIGGLGNQMFEYAFARHLQITYNEDLCMDCSAYNSYKIRNYSLKNLNINKDVSLIEKTDITKGEKAYLKISQKTYHFIQKLIKVIKRSDRIGSGLYRFLSKRGLYFNFDRYYYKLLKSDVKIKCVYGYFQSEKYFENSLQTVRCELKVCVSLTDREKEMLEEIANCEAVGISIREGEDYKKSDLGVCTPEFFYRGMEVIASRVKNPIFYIFSDCIEQVKGNYQFKYPVKYIENVEDYEGLRLLYSCKHFIIANSSFSWWGCYLSDYKDKIVVAPSKWYKNSETVPDIYGDFMTLIEV